eukprot:732598-Pyramimonas_sp.AAC.1
MLWFYLGAAVEEKERVASADLFRKRAWNVSIGASDVTEAGGLSAGVAVRCKSHIGMSPPPSTPRALPFPERIQLR